MSHTPRSDSKYIRALVKGRSVYVGKAFCSDTMRWVETPAYTDRVDALVGAAGLAMRYDTATLTKRWPANSTRGELERTVFFFRRNGRDIKTINLPSKVHARKF